VSRYVDGFVIPIPTRNLGRYRKIARMACLLWTEHGALDYHECVLEDPATPSAPPFPQAIRAKRGETVVFAWIAFKSRAHRDRVNARVMADPRLSTICDPRKMPFDPRRMLYGGFARFVGSDEMRRRR